VDWNLEAFPIGYDCAATVACDGPTSFGPLSFGPLCFWIEDAASAC